jgi:hypothetical protein
MRSLCILNTVTIKPAMPVFPETAVDVGVLTAPVPPKVTLDARTSVAFEEVALRVRLPVCGSDGQRCTAAFPNPRDADASYTLQSSEERATDKQGRGFSVGNWESRGER